MNMSHITLELIPPNWWVTCHNKQTGQKVQVCCERHTQVEFVFENIHKALFSLGEAGFYFTARRIRDRDRELARLKLVKPAERTEQERLQYVKSAGLS